MSVGAQVAFLGNMNNNHFAMARFLRDRGIEAIVLLFDHEQGHFRPSADTFDRDYMQYTGYLDWGSSPKFLTTTSEQIRQDLLPYPVIIGCGLAPAYCEKGGRVLDVFVPYGGDLVRETSFRLVSPHLLPSVWAAAHYQRKGIARARIAHMALTNDLFEKQYEKFRGVAERWHEGMPMVHSPTYSPETIHSMCSRTHWGHEFAQLRAKNDLVVVYHGRHYWDCKPDDFGAKGTDKLIAGWAEFVRRNPGVKAVLQTMEYGKDVQRTKALIRDLDIEHAVAWFPPMYRKDIMVGLAMADIVCGQFENNWIMSGVLYEALVLGKPILAYRDDSEYESMYSWLYPIMHAREPQTIVAQLERYLENPSACKKLGEEGREWYQQEVVNKSLDKYMAYISERTSKTRTD